MKRRVRAFWGIGLFALVSALAAWRAHSADTPVAREPTAERRAGSEPRQPQLDAERLLQRRALLQAAQDEARREAFRAKHTAERVDPDWSEQERVRILDLFSAAGAAARLRELDCRENLCRFVTTPGAEAVLDQPFPGGKFFHAGAEEGTTVVYSFRPGRREVIQEISRQARAQAQLALTASAAPASRVAEDSD
jgi:hypothetical protein